MFGVERLEIPATKTLDPLIVYIDQKEPSKGHITIICFGKSWTCYWNATGNYTVKQFFQTCSIDYLLGCFSRGSGGSAYLERVLKRVQEYMWDN